MHAKITIILVEIKSEANEDDDLVVGKLSEN